MSITYCRFHLLNKRRAIRIAVTAGPGTRSRYPVCKDCAKPFYQNGWNMQPIGNRRKPFEDYAR